MSENEPLEISTDQSLRGILTHEKSILAELRNQTRLLKRINFVVQLFGLVLILSFLGSCISIVLTLTGVIGLSGALLGGNGGF